MERDSFAGEAVLEDPARWLPLTDGHHGAVAGRRRPATGAADEGAARTASVIGPRGSRGRSPVGGQGVRGRRARTWVPGLRNVAAHQGRLRQRPAWASSISPATLGPVETSRGPAGVGRRLGDVAQLAVRAQPRTTSPLALPAHPFSETGQALPSSSGSLAGARGRGTATAPSPAYGDAPTDTTDPASSPPGSAPGGRRAAGRPATSPAHARPPRRRARAEFPSAVALARLPSSSYAPSTHRTV